MPNDRRLFAVALAVPILILFRSVLTGDEALFARDVFHQYWPLRAHVVEAFATGHLPLWDDGSQAGLPLLANLHAAVLYPPNALYQLVSFSTGYGWLVTLHLVWLAWGLFAWLTAMGRGSFSSAVGAMVVTVSAPVLGLTAFGPNLMGLAWLPWFAHALVRRGPPASRLIQAAVVVTLQCLCGDPMSVLLSALVLGALMASLREVGFDGLDLTGGRPSVPNRRQLLVLGTLAGFIGVLLAGVQLLPAYGLLQQTTRAAGGDQLDLSTHPVRFLELLAPRLFGGFETLPAYWGSFLASGTISTPFSLSVYVGAGACFIALLGARQPASRVLGLTLVIVGGVLALGAHFVAGPLLSHVPPFSLFRYPEKYLVLTVLGLGVLVADGLDALAARRPARGDTVIWSVCASLGGAVAVSLLAVPGAWSGWVERTWPGLPPEVALDSFLFAASTFAGLGFSVVVLAQLASARVRSWALGAVLVGDALVMNHAVVFTTPAELYSQRPPVIDAMLEAAPHRPFRLWRDNEAMARTQFATATPEQRVLQRAYELITLKSSLPTVFGLQELSGYSPVVLSRWESLLVALQGQPGAALTLFNTCFTIGPAAAGEAVFAPLPEGAAVRRIDCLPRLFSVRETIGVSTQREALAAVAAAPFSIRTSAVVEAGRTVGGLEAVDVSEVVARSGAISASVQAAEKGGFLVFATSYAAGWSTTIDGHPAPLFVVDGAVMGTEISAGAHHVSFEFEEPLLGAGAAASSLGALLLIAVWVGRRRLAEHPFIS